MAKHKCDGCVVYCMDWRIQKFIPGLMRSLGINTYDCLALPGGAGKNPEQVDKWIDMSCQLHDSDDIILTVHEDCGAGATEQDLLAALKRAKAAHPDKNIAGFLINLNGSWKQTG